MKSKETKLHSTDTLLFHAVSCIRFSKEANRVSKDLVREILRANKGKEISFLSGNGGYVLSLNYDSTWEEEHVQGIRLSEEGLIEITITLDVDEHGNDVPAWGAATINEYNHYTNFNWVSILEGLIKEIYGIDTEISDVGISKLEENKE